MEGIPEKDKWTVDTPLGFDATSRVPIKMGVGTLPAETIFTVLDRGFDRTLPSATPHGGRQHQIRIHARLSGFPLVGDKLYGPNESFFLNRTQPLTELDLRILGHWRQTLHAYRLSAEFLPQSFEISPPKDWLNIRGIPDLSPYFSRHVSDS